MFGLLGRSHKSFSAILLAVLSVLVLSQCTKPKSTENQKDGYNPSTDSLRYAGEVHLRNIRQLTFGGNNAEAYWSFDDKQLIFQSDWSKINNQGCDQIYIMNADGTLLQNGERYQMVSTGKGRTTCSYFTADKALVYASTHEADQNCPEPVQFVQGKYVWPIYDGYDIYIKENPNEESELLIGGEGYDAEATVSPDGRYAVFTSTRSGDLELWRYEFTTGDLLQLTDELGYDGGAFFSPDSRKIVWRASRPEGAEADSYIALLKQGLVEPGDLNIFIADIDGSNVQQVTNLPGANWAPFFHPSGEKIIFASNHHSMETGGRLFDLFLINVDGTSLTKLTHSGTFDAFPMFSFDGTKISFASNRRVDGTQSRETNVFVADWVETPTEVDINFGK